MLDWVGEASTPAAYWSIDGLSGSDIYFRLRLAETPETGSLVPPLSCIGTDCAWGVLIDADESLEDFEYMLVLNLPENAIQVWSGSSESGWSASAETLEDSFSTDWPSAVFDITDAGTTLGGAANVFIEFAVPRSVFGLIDDDAVIRAAVASHLGTITEGLSADLLSSASEDSLDTAWSDPIGIDGDGDGLPIDIEISLGSDPQDADTDDDGLDDGSEGVHGTSPLEADSDDDGLSDGDEVLIHLTNPTHEDSDDDGLTDFEEIELYETDPNDPLDPDPADADCDGRPDAVDDDIDGDGDFDGDGLSNETEWECGTDPCVPDPDADGDSVPNPDDIEPCDPDVPDLDIDEDCDGIADWEDTDITVTEDMDGDGILNVDETWCGGDPCVPEFDIDGDGLTNAEEAILGTDPCNVTDPDQDKDEDCDDEPDYLDDFIEFDPEGDNDLDNILNGHEIDVCGTDPCTPNEDPDSDGVSNAREAECGTDPCHPDTDNDGQWDNDELGSSGCGGDEDGDGIPDATDSDGTVASDPIDPDDKKYGFSGGAFTGGGCSQAPGPTTFFGIALALFAISARRFPAFVLVLLIPLGLRAETIDAQRFENTLDTRTFIGLTDSVESKRGWLGSMLLHHARDPLLYRVEDPHRSNIRILGNVWTTDWTGGYNFGKWALGLHFPLHVYASGDEMSQTATMGDIRGSGQVVFIDRRDGPVGLSTSASVGLPTGNKAMWLRQPGISGTAFLNASLGTQVIGAASLGMTAIEEVILDGLSLGLAARWKMGVHVPITDIAWTSLELDAAHNLGNSASKVSGAHPIELNGYGRMEVTQGWMLTLGGGTAISKGVGAPSFRLLAGISTAPDWSLKARVPSQPTEAPPAEPPPTPISSEALLQISVSTENAQPIPARIVVLDSEEETRTNEDGIALVTRPGGTTTIRVLADGYTPVQRTLRLEPGEESTMVIVLAQSRVTIEEDRLIIHDKVFFETGSSQIASTSFDLLDEVALVILDNPGLLKIEVQGHTDDVGNEQDNLSLSQTRADAVVQHLISAGVDGARLSAKGFGEGIPLNPQTSEEARAQNRRVEFHVLEREN